MSSLLAIWTSNPHVIRDKLRSRDYNVRTLIYGHGMIPGVGADVLTGIVEEFDRAAANVLDDKSALFLAINSRVSLNILKGQGLDIPSWGLDSPYKEAEKIIPRLRQVHPSRLIITATFDEVDPRPLYRQLSVKGSGLSIPHAFTMQGNKPVPL